MTESLITRPPAPSTARVDSAPRVDLVIADLARRQHGIVATAQLLAHGIERRAIQRRVRDGRLHRVHRGVLACGHAALSDEARYMAAVMLGGPHAALCGNAAARHLALSRWGDRGIEVVRRGQTRHVDSVCIRVSGNFERRDLHVVRGIPTVRLPWLLLTLARRLTPHQLAWVLHQAGRTRPVPLIDIEALVARVHGHHDVPRVTAALALRRSGSRGTRSSWEDMFLAQAVTLHGRVGLPVPEVNVMPLPGVTLERDFVWCAARLIVEVDGPAHARPGDRLRDVAHDVLLRQHGWEVLRCTPRRFTSTLTAVCDRFGLAPGRT